MAKGRFIAGAVCPQCRAMDTIVLHRAPEGDERECVACDFSDKVADLADDAQDLALLPAGKLDATATGRKTTGSVQEEVSRPVRFVTPQSQSTPDKKDPN